MQKRHKDRTRGTGGNSSRISRRNESRKKSGRRGRKWTGRKREKRATRGKRGRRGKRKSRRGTGRRRGRGRKWGRRRRRGHRKGRGKHRQNEAEKTDTRTVARWQQATPLFLPHPPYVHHCSCDIRHNKFTSPTLSKLSTPTTPNTCLTSLQIPYTSPCSGQSQCQAKSFNH